MNLTGWSKSLEVTADGEGIVSHPGLALLRQLADKTGLTGGLSHALASPRLLIHDRGRVTADLACAIADGSEVISDFRVLADQKELFGLVASVPTMWRALDEIGAGGPQALTRITGAVNGARRQAWAAIEARHGALPGARIADKVLKGVTCIRLDATVTPAHSGKELAEPNFKGFGHHPYARFRDEFRVAGRRFNRRGLAVLAAAARPGRRPGPRRAENVASCYRILHAAGKLVRGGRRRRLKIPATWPWADAIATAWARIAALPQAP